MAITLAQFRQAHGAAEAIETKRANLALLTEQVATYTNGGEMPSELQTALRPWLADKMQARLGAYKAGIDADVAALKALVTDFV